MYDKIVVTWSYVGGYDFSSPPTQPDPTPPALRMIATRLAWWHYELRKAPLGRVAMPPMGEMLIPVAIPPDVRYSLRPWALWG